MAQPRNSALIDFHEKTIYKLEAFYSVTFNNTCHVAENKSEFGILELFLELFGRIIIVIDI